MSVRCGTLICFLAGVLFSCTPTLKDTIPMQEMTTFHEPKLEPQVRSEGSLWTGEGPLNELFVNMKARKAGDVITISIVESSSASNNASTSTSRDSSLSAGIDSFLGMQNRYPTTSNPYFNPFGRIKGDLQSAFDGTGTTKRSGSLTAHIAARVTEVLPSGNLRIMGSREVLINNEKQVMALMGTVRPRDISPENVVLSTHVSEAKIVYTGEGIVQERQRPGWLARIFDAVWPF